MFCDLFIFLLNNTNSKDVCLSLNKELIFINILKIKYLWCFDDHVNSVRYNLYDCIDFIIFVYFCY